MKKAFLLIITIVILFSCKKEKDTVAEIYKPRLIDSYGGSTFNIYDLQNTKSVKFYYYQWNSTTFKFDLNATIDTSANYYNLKSWPQSVSDAVSTGGFYFHFQDRAIADKTYILTDVSLTNNTLTADHPGIPARWKVAKKTDAYFYIYEAYGETTSRSSYFFFDFEAGEYLFKRKGNFIDAYKITDLIKTPNGNMATDPIDWTLGDAAFSYNDTRYTGETAVVVLDYDAKKYVMFTRKNTNIGDAGRQTLRTTSWMPISDLINNWKF